MNPGPREVALSLHIVDGLSHLTRAGVELGAARRAVAALDGGESPSDVELHEVWSAMALFREQIEALKNRLRVLANQPDVTLAASHSGTGCDLCTAVAKIRELTEGPESTGERRTGGVA